MTSDVTILFVTQRGGGVQTFNVCSPPPQKEIWEITLMEMDHEASTMPQEYFILKSLYDVFVALTGTTAKLNTVRSPYSFQVLLI